MDMKDVVVNMGEHSKGGGFNWALLIGCFAIALGIFLAGGRIADRIPHSMHGSFHGNFSTGTHFSEPREFMSEWEAASFVMMGQAQFNALIQSGELQGTYTVFQVEEQQWHWDDQWHFVEGAWSREVQVFPPAISVDASGWTTPMPPRPMEYEMVIVDLRVFSRERLTAWLMERIDG